MNQIVQHIRTLDVATTSSVIYLRDVVANSSVSLSVGCCYSQ
jgi:hypothetical protein